VVDNTLISCENVSKVFCKDLKKSLLYGVTNIVGDLLPFNSQKSPGNDSSPLKLRPKEFIAVNNVSFKLKRGEFVGLIGHNGAGKTTLLRMLNGLIKPDQGLIKIHGQVGALIALGAGFIPVLTGRENILVNASVLGLSQTEIKNKLDEIIDFSGLHDFIDTPLQSYSSGMVVRLGFAIATALRPDVLLLDEILAVGDRQFQRKCLKRVHDFVDGGGLVLLVTHTLEHVAHYCTRAILLDNGQIIQDGKPSDVLDSYRELEKAKGGHTPQPQMPPIYDINSFEKHPLYNPAETRWGDKKAQIQSFKIFQNESECFSEICSGTDTKIVITIHFQESVNFPIFGFLIRSTDGDDVLSTNSKSLSHVKPIQTQEKGSTLRLAFTFKPFLDAGAYLLSIGVASESIAEIVAHDRRYNSISLNVAHPLHQSGDVDMQPTIIYLNQNKNE